MLNWGEGSGGGGGGGGGEGQTDRWTKRGISK